MFGFSRNKMEQSPISKALENKSDEEKIETFKKMGTISYQNILIRAQEMLSDENNEKLNQISDGPDSEQKMFNFLQETIPNFSEVIKEEVEKTQELIENNMSAKENEINETENEAELNPENIDVESIMKIGELSLRKICSEILNTSEGKEKEDFEKVLNTEDEQQITSYIEKNYPDLIDEKGKEIEDDLEFFRNEINKNLERMESEEQNDTK